MEDTEHQVAPGLGAIRVAARVVVGRPLHHRHQQRDLVGLEVGNVAAEPEARGRTDAVDALAALLPEVDLVQVRLEDAALVEARPMISA